ncbi:hypothetical protein T11_9224, partial [Trichinella zimbabwensis]
LVKCTLDQCTFPLSTRDFGLTKFPIVNCTCTIAAFPAALHLSSAITTFVTQQILLFAISE